MALGCGFEFLVLGFSFWVSIGSCCDFVSVVLFAGWGLVRVPGFWVGFVLGFGLLLYVLP